MSDIVNFLDSIALGAVRLKRAVEKNSNVASEIFELVVTVDTDLWEIVEIAEETQPYFAKEKDNEA